SHQVVDGREILVEIKAVNHRYFEFAARVPRTYGYLEEKLKSLTAGQVSRGKIEINVSIYTTSGQDEDVVINRSLVKGYLDALRGIQDEFGLTDDLSLSVAARFPDAFNIHKIIEDENVVWEAVKPVAEEALQKFSQMRVHEGENLKEDLLGKIQEMEEIIEKIEIRSPLVVQSYRTRLYERLKEVLEDKNIEEQRVLTEAALFAEKIAVDEETVRLHSHMQQFREILQLDEPIGRKLDFLVQEMNRETNTIGSKASDLDTTKMVIDLKALIEKVREQIQNIE
ncbi:MAG TPA: YicC family protein, partial [Firmicutes bacterium]|nr:YicC family protein [Bacillota bacterium]